MTQKLFADNAAKIAFILEFPKHRCRRSSHGIPEIHGVHQVDSQRNAVDNDKQHLANTMIAGTFLQVQRKEHHNDVEGIGIKDGGGIEHQSSSEDVGGVSQIVGILQIVCTACYLVDKIGQQKVPKHGHCWGITLTE